MARYNTQFTLVEDSTTNPQTLTLTFPFNVVAIECIYLLAGQINNTDGWGMDDFWVSAITISNNTVAVTITRLNADPAHKSLFVTARG